MKSHITPAFAALTLAAMNLTSPANAALITVSANSGNTIGVGPFINPPYTAQHQIQNMLPVPGVSPGYLRTTINGVFTSAPGSPETRWSVATSEPQSSASAYADLRLGKIGAYAGTTPFGFASSSASISDRLTFDIAGADATTITPLRFRISLHASALDAFGIMTFSGYSWYGTLENGYAYNVQPYVQQHSTWLEGTTRYFDLTYRLQGEDPAFSPDFSLEAIASSGSVSDFSNTGGIKIFVARGATFTSESGQFLAGVGGVPEPATWAMLIAGFGLVGTAARRRRTAYASA